MRQSIFLVIFLWLIIHISDAQHYHFKQYSLEEGLPQSEVSSLTQDQFGYLWLGTNGGGLCRFNGKDFEVFTKRDGLFDNIILGLLHDQDYNLWIATQKGLQRYNGFEYQTIIQSDTTIFTDNVEFCETNDGKIFCLARLISGDNILYLIDNESIVNITDKYKDELKDKGPVIKIMCDGKNGLLVATVRETLNFKNNVFSSYDNGLLTTEEKSIKLPLFRDRSKKLWVSIIGHNNSRKLLIHTEGVGNKEVTLPKEVQNLIIFKGMQDREGNYWFLVENGGVLRYHTKDGWHVFNKQNGLPINTVFNLLQDDEGNLWMGTLGAGIIRYSGDLFLSLNRDNGLTDDIIRAIYQDSKGRYYFADGEGGFSILKDEKVEVFSKTNLPSLRAVKEFYGLPDGKILLATMNGLWEFDGKNAKPVNERYGWKKHLPISDIVLKQDTFFFSTYDFGLIKSYNGKATFFNTYNSNMQDNTIFHSLVDSKNRLWLSTSRGITLYQNGEFEAFTEGKNISSSYILQAAEDKIGNIWFATYTDGLLCYNDKNWSVFDTDKGLSSNNIYSVIADKDGNIFAGAQNGVDKLSIASNGTILGIKNFDKHDGFIGIENNGTANFLDDKGYLWFGTIKGAMRYNPTQKRSNFLEPKIHIRNIELSNKSPNWKEEPFISSYDSIVPWFNIPNRLNLSSKENTIAFTFDALCYSVPEKIKYRWRLEPLESEWLEGTDNTVNYPSLPSGDYTFRVTAANNSNIWNEEGAIFQFSIHPKWHQSASFRALIILLLVGLIAAFVISWKKRSQTLRFEMQTLLASKTSELTDKKDKISEQKQLITQLYQTVSDQDTIIEEALTGLRNLNSIGDKISANLSFEHILNLIYKASSEVMNTYLFGFGFFNKEQNSLDFKNVMLKGERMPFMTFPLDDLDRLAIHSYINNKEIFINNFNEEYTKYVNEIRPVPGDINSQSIMYLPLKVNNAPFGVLTVQSANTNEYSEYHLAFMRSICLFASIAIENSEAIIGQEKQKEKASNNEKVSREQNNKLKEQQAIVNQLNLENNQLISLFTQEIQRPLSASIDLLNSIKTEDNVSDIEKDEAVQYVFDALWQIKDISNQLSDIKRIESEDYTLNKSKVKLELLINEIASQHKINLIDKEIVLNNKVGNAIVETDYTILEKIISNLLSNAITFTFAETSIECNAEEDEDGLTLSISDEGPGIDDELLPDIFTKFTKKATKSSGHKPSSGLGLYIVKRYVDILNGTIECVSTVGKGTTFKVKLPK